MEDQGIIKLRVTSLSSKDLSDVTVFDLGSRKMCPDERIQIDSCIPTKSVREIFGYFKIIAPTIYGFSFYHNKKHERISFDIIDKFYTGAILTVNYNTLLTQKPNKGYRSSVFLRESELPTIASTTKFVLKELKANESIEIHLYTQKPQS